MQLWGKRRGAPARFIITWARTQVLEIVSEWDELEKIHLAMTVNRKQRRKLGIFPKRYVMKVKKSAFSSLPLVAEKLLMTCRLSFIGQGDSCKESARFWHLSCSWIIHFLLISLFTDISCSEWGSQVLQQTNKSKVHRMWREAAALEKGLFESTPLGKGVLS